MARSRTGKPRGKATPKRVGHAVGERITALRVEKALTLESVASGTGLTPSFLSRLERGHTTVSVDNLRRIARFLGVEMVHFFQSELPAELTVTRRNAGTQLSLDGTTAYGESLIGTTQSGLQATIYRTSPGQGRREGFSHTGEEFVFVIRGRLRYRAGQTEVTLRAGDSVWHKSTLPHLWKNTGSTVSVTLHVNTPPVW
jgi:transcriptional regulator with XRE-family HTH domain